MNIELLSIISKFLVDLKALDGKFCPFCGAGRNFDWDDYYHESGCPRRSIIYECDEALKYITTRDEEIAE